MTEVISVKFRTAGKLYFFSPGELKIKTGSHVIVETARGIEYGDVVQGNHAVDDALIVPPLKEILREATEEDTAHEMENREKEQDAFRTCKEKIRKHDLDMKLISCEYTFDNSKILFYFTSDGRVDFRELVKDLASQFRTRIELRQVGVRDETKMLGGLGSCGRPLCCASYLNDFVPVSIKMAKEQNLSLNPLKISGVCGRLMCCLKNEEDVYEELNKKLPGVGDVVEAADGTVGEVHSVSILKQLVKVVVTLPGDEKEIREFDADDLTVKLKRKEKNRQRLEAQAEELRELEGLEKKERKEKGERKERPQKEDRRPRQEKQEKPRREKPDGNGEKAAPKGNGEKAAPKGNAREKDGEAASEKPRRRRDGHHGHHRGGNHENGGNPEAKNNAENG